MDMMMNLPLHTPSDAVRSDVAPSQPREAAVASDWREKLPMLHGSSITLRELRTSDAASLLMMLATEEVSRFVSPPPTTVEGFEKFIAWALQRQREGRFACFAVVPHGMDTAVGLFQIKALESGFETAEWGFALGSPFWGTGIFSEGAELVVGFAFEQLNVHRLEARAMVANGRGNGALRKIGAVPEGVLRQSFKKDGQLHDQMLWSILEQDWRQAKGRPELADTPECLTTTPIEKTSPTYRVH